MILGESNYFMFPVSQNSIHQISYLVNYNTNLLRTESIRKFTSTKVTNVCNYARHWRFRRRWMQGREKRKTDELH